MIEGGECGVVYGSQPCGGIERSMTLSRDIITLCEGEDFTPFPK